MDLFSQGSSHFMGVARPLVNGIQTGEIKTVTSQSKAGLGTQGAIQTRSYPEALPAPKDMEIPD